MLVYMKQLGQVLFTVSFLEAQTEEVEVAAMYHSSLQVSSKPQASCSSFESLILSLSHHKSQFY